VAITASSCRRGPLPVSPPLVFQPLCHRAQAIAIGQALVDGRWLDCITHHDQLFRDEYALYRPLQVAAGITQLNESKMTGMNEFARADIYLYRHVHR